MNAASTAASHTGLGARRLFGAFCALVLASTALAIDPSAMSRATGELISVIVRELPGSGDGPERAVEELGGDVGRHVEIIDGFVADLPSGGVDALRAAPWVHSVTPDRRVRLLHTVDGYDASTTAGSMFNTANSIKAKDYWTAGYTGAGVDVALIDSGVVAVEGLTIPGKVINGPDLSVESQSDTYRYLDSYGHGTHMAGIIAGRDTAATSTNGHDNFLGIAPDARILNVKVAGHNGATDVSQVIAAIDWVVQHRNDNGMNVRVLNLSFGTDGTQDYRLDPLAYAAEVAWHKGIVVVVAAGNSQFGNSKLNNPAYDPYLFAVGANDTRGTYTTDDDIVPDWSARGDGTRNPDLVAPGKSIVSLRNPNSHIDLTHPEGRVNARFFRGSGTSQAAAVVAGAAALVLQQRPTATPDQVKGLLTSTASKLPVADPIAQGAGVVNLKQALRAPTPNYVQTWERSSGTGLLEAARGSGHLVDTTNGIELRGEQDLLGSPWDGQSWSGQSWSGQSWSGGMWNGQSWSGQSWSGQSWSGQSWSGQSWSGQSWSGQSWSGQSWSGQSWSGQSWSGQSWSGQSWSGQSWSGQSWSGQSWSGQSWSGQSWSSSIWGADYDPSEVFCDDACEAAAKAHAGSHKSEHHGQGHDGASPSTDASGGSDAAPVPEQAATPEDDTAAEPVPSDEVTGTEPAPSEEAGEAEPAPSGPGKGAATEPAPSEGSAGSEQAATSEEPAAEEPSPPDEEPAPTEPEPASDQQV